MVFAGPAAYCKGRINTPALPIERAKCNTYMYAPLFVMVAATAVHRISPHVLINRPARRQTHAALSRLAGDRYPQDRQRNGQGPSPKATAL